MAKAKAQRVNHGGRNLPVAVRVSQRQRAILNHKVLAGTIAELANEHKTLAEKFERFVEHHNALVKHGNAINQRCNLILTELEFHRELFTEIGHVHSPVLGRTVEFTGEMYGEALDKHLKRKAEELKRIIAERPPADLEQPTTEHAAPAETADEPEPVAAAKC